MNRGGLAEGSACGLPESFQRGRKKLFVQKLGLREMVFMWLNNSLNVASNGVVSNRWVVFRVSPCSLLVGTTGHL